MTVLAYAACGLTLAACYVSAARSLRLHPVWRARYLTARLLHPCPGRYPDGGELTGDEWLELDRIAVRETA